MDPKLSRKSALSIAREMAAEGLNKNQVHAELTTLGLHHSISQSEIGEIVAQNRPAWWKRSNRSYFETRKVLGAVLVVASLAVLVAFAYIVLSDREPGETWSDLAAKCDSRGGMRLTVYAVVGFLAGLWIFFRPDDGDEGMI